MATLVGDIFRLEGRETSNSIMVSTEAATNFFTSIAVRQQDVNGQALGLYSQMILDRANLKAKFMTFKGGKHLFRARANGCEWNPTGKIRTNLQEYSTCPIEFNGEVCPDAFYNSCLEAIFAPGRGVRDIAGTPEGQGILAKLVERINLELGNSFYNLFQYANHPLIDTINALNRYPSRISTEEWLDFVAQMTGPDCAGLLTLLDQLKAEGVRGYDLNITTVNEQTGAFTGDIFALIETLKDAASSELSTAIDRGVIIDGQLRYPIVLLAPAEYRAFQLKVEAMGPLESVFRFQLNGDIPVLGMNKNLLGYYGMPVIKWDACQQMDMMLGTQSHRAAIVMPGNFGVLSDVQALNNASGYGMVIQQSTEVQYKGKIFMDTALRYGSGLADLDYAVMASNILVPVA